MKEKTKRKQTEQHLSDIQQQIFQRQINIINGNNLFLTSCYDQIRQIGSLGTYIYKQRSLIIFFQIMLKCEICNIGPQTPALTRCCKLFICDGCKQKFQKNGVCICGKNAANKKITSNNNELFQIIKAYYEGRPQQCDRCEKIADIECNDCSMVYCPQCNIQVHNGRGFAKHDREMIQKEQKSHKKLIERARKKQQWCQQHKQVLETVCQCGSLLCSSCVKTHKQSCAKMTKTKTYKEYKEQYFSQILFRIKKISEYKEKLQSDKKDYLQHFNKQRQTFQTYSKLVDDQLEGIKKILEMKIIEIKSRLSEYWKQCINVHNKNQYMIDFHLRKFDDFGRLSEKFTQKIIGIDYLEKRVKRIYLNQQFFNFKLQGVQQVQFSIINMSTIFKNWEVNQQQNILLNLDTNQEKNLKQKEKEKRIQQNFTNSGTTNSQILLQCSQNPLSNRPLTLKSSHNQVLFQFLHLPYQNQTYEIEYGVGLKMKGQEVFKKIENRNGTGIINNLNPSTKYRVRMKVIGGDWGPITEIKTQEIPRLLTQNCPANKYNQEILQVLKSGVIYGSNQIYFGIHIWQIKIFPAKHNDEETACISVGVTNKEQKKPVFVGTTLNYGYQKAQITVKITLNCDENRMIISSSTGNQDQIYQNLPNFPIYPAIQNKGSHPVQIQCIFY